MDSRKTPYFIFYSNYALETETLCPAGLSQFCNSTNFFSLPAHFAIDKTALLFVTLLTVFQTAF